jgi:hypothetical protein
MSREEEQITLAILQPTAAFLRLVEKAAYNNHNKTISAKDKFAKLDFTSSCKDIQEEFKRDYLDNVGQSILFAGWS